ncbi:MAG TPA: outer membrane protein assembly factor BamE [Ideonella sp.]|uniref:outer membrane protein assembly factor BamE n=1 Tax=Ideonella sp. TaxID=1929293 RepID=UPI002E3320AC|nr:outer membrane protein assembly factor BamE [Ideonella sp.]HEX5686030.1 outer membrane protein assembly factor BamE [Ideonella sp.]
MPLFRLPRIVPVTAALLGLATLAGCTLITRTMSDGITSVITPYRVEVVQGNVVTREQIAAIKPGTQRARVRDVLGSPLLADPFHAQRWDYVFVIRRQGTEPQQRSVVVLFDGDVVKSVQAPDLPSELEFVASISRPSRGEVPKLELTDEERKNLPLPPKVETAAAAAVPQGAVRNYPPLEAP